MGRIIPYGKLKSCLKPPTRLISKSLLSPGLGSGKILKFVTSNTRRHLAQLWWCVSQVSYLARQQSQQSDSPAALLVDAYTFGEPIQGNAPSIFILNPTTNMEMKFRTREVSHSTMFFIFKVNHSECHLGETIMCHHFQKRWCFAVQTEIDKQINIVYIDNTYTCILYILYYELYIICHIICILYYIYVYIL